MSRNPETTLEELRLAIHGVAAPFSCEGGFLPKAPVTLVFEDATRYEVARAAREYEQTQQLRPYLKYFQSAPFGEGKKTRYDDRVRNALQLKAERNGLSVENFDPESAGVLKQIQRELLPRDPRPITAELYAVNVYTDGGHFAPHKDTPRGGDMFGTLVVCLPSRFHSGELVLRHRGLARTFDWAEAIRNQKQPSQIHWAAFYGDVDHEIRRLYGGARITLTYLLRQGDGVQPEREVADEDLPPHVQKAWRKLLDDPTFMPEGGVLAYPCAHLYHQDARFQVEQKPITQQSETMLKGRDQLVAATAIQAGLGVAFTPYLFENCANDTWRMDRFPTSKDRARMGRRVDPSGLEAALPILADSDNDGDGDVTWLEPAPSSDWGFADSQQEGVTATAALFHSCEFSATGYFGNEGSEVDFYTFAALHIEIPSYGKGPRAASEPPKPKRTPPKRRSPAPKAKSAPKSAGSSSRPKRKSS